MRALWCVAALIAASCVSPLAAAEDQPCGVFTWDLALENALFGTAANSQIAGRDLKTAPDLVADTLYELQLAPEREVRFVTEPGKPPPQQASFGGIARFTVIPAGTYRISVGQPVWLDVVSDGKAIASKDAQGREGCSAPHKVVEFVLPIGPLTLQISGASQPTVRLTVTPAPAEAVVPVSAPAAKP